MLAPRAVAAFQIGGGRRSVTMRSCTTTSNDPMPSLYYLAAIAFFCTAIAYIVHVW